jgi:shikimate kinase
MATTSAPGNIFLVGPMGAGKSSVGRQLAKALHCTFIDSDHVIEERTGVSIPLIFDIEGEEGFRQREEQIIDELTCQQGIVLATGGGAVLRETNRQHLHKRGTVIYLSATVEQLFERTRRDRNRPLLQTDNPRARIEELLTQRDPLYRQIAHHVINTDGHSVRYVVSTILQALGVQIT